VRRRVHQVTQLVVMAAIVSVLWPASAHAQRPVHVHSHHSFAVGAAYGGPYFYYPGFYYSAFAGPGWYGYPWGPWGPWPYGYYGYYDPTSSARIQGAPREADVYVDGYYAGRVDDFDGTFQRLRVAPGEHDIAIYLDGYRSTKQSILFRPGAGYKINATLEKLPEGEHSEARPTPLPQSDRPYAPPPPRRGDRQAEREQPASAEDAPGFGTLAIRVQPAGASVLVDGERWEGPDGSGERLLVQVKEGPHRIDVQKDGYQSYSTNVDVRGGQTATLNVSLPQERQ